MQTVAINISLLFEAETRRKVTHEVDRSEAPMADLSQVCEELFGILPKEQLSHLRVLQAPGPHTRRHGQRLMSAEGTNWVSVCYLEGLTHWCRNMRPQRKIHTGYVQFVCVCVCV